MSSEIGVSSTTPKRAVETDIRAAFDLAGNESYPHTYKRPFQKVSYPDQTVPRTSHVASGVVLNPVT